MPPKGILFNGNTISYEDKNITIAYCENDIKATMNILEHQCFMQNMQIGRIDKCVKKVIFHGPATIIFWKDGTKTVVKYQEGDIFDQEKGLAMAICKKVMGNESNFNNQFKKIFEQKTEIKGDLK